MNDFIVEDYRSVIANQLLSNELVVGILSNDTITNIEEADILIDDTKEKSDQNGTCHIKAQHYVDGAIETTGSYIMFDLDEVPQYSNNSKQNAYTEVRLYFWVITNKNMAKYRTKRKEEPFKSAKNKYRNDLLAREIKGMFEYKNNLGIAPNHLVYNKIFIPENKGYYGRMLYFTITDFSNKVRDRAVGLYV